MDALKELHDGAIDAGCICADGTLDAAQLRVRTTILDDRIIVADTASGLNIEELRNALCINDIKAPSNKIGTKGSGTKAAMAVLSNLKTKPIIFSQKSGHEVCNVVVDFPACIEQGVWYPAPSDLSRLNATTWESSKLDGEHGTVIIIPLPPRATLPPLQSLLCDLGVTYENYIQDGVSITVVAGGVEHAPDMSMALGYETTPVDMRDDTPIHILTSPDGLEERFYWRHSCLKPVWTDWVREIPENPGAGYTSLLRDYAEAIEAGFTVNTLRYRQVYSEDWNTPGAAVIPGYTALRRGKRVLRTIPTKPATTGDMSARKVFDSIRGSLDFSHSEDKFFNIQVDKSAVNPDNIHPGLTTLITRIKQRWVGELTKRIDAQPMARPPDSFEARLKRAVDEFRKTARRNEQFLDDYADWFEDYRGFDSNSELDD